ncbi:MAG: hypothetical protein ACLFN9_20600 [Desulfococcaceae bacterium]
MQRNLMAHFGVAGMNENRNGRKNHGKGEKEPGRSPPFPKEKQTDPGHGCQKGRNAHPLPKVTEIIDDAAPIEGQIDFRAVDVGGVSDDTGGENDMGIPETFSI